MKNQGVDTGSAGAGRHVCKVPNGVNLGVGLRASPRMTSR